MAETQTQREFYSNSAHYSIRYTLGKPVIENGIRMGREGEEFIEFHPFGKHGRYVTSDPGKIAFLEKQGDIFGPEEFDRQITPKDQLLARAERKIEQQNRLIEQMKLNQQLTKGVAPSPTK